MLIDIPDLTEKDKARFWAKVDKRGENECWEWTAGKSSEGYGNFWISGKYYLAHRIAWVLQKGAIPPGKLVCHSCDNPPCKNANHFFLGTNKDNMRDAVKKGRMSNGDRNGNSVLTEFKVLDIRRRFSEGETQINISKDFGISAMQVSYIVNKKRWAHI